MINYNLIYIIIFIFIFICMGYMFYLDLNPEAKANRWIKDRSFFFVIVRISILVVLIFTCSIMWKLLLNFQNVYVEIDPLRYRGVLIFTTGIIFSFLGMIVMGLWGWLLAIKFSTSVLKAAIQSNSSKQSSLQKAVKHPIEKHFILNELKHFAMIIFITVLVMWIGTAITKGYFEVKNTQSLYDSLIEKSIIKDSEAYSVSDLKITLSYLIKDLSFYVSFFSILTISFMLPLGYKLIFNVKNKK